MRVQETKHLPLQFSHNFLLFLHILLPIQLPLMHIHVHQLLKNCHVFMK